MTALNRRRPNPLTFFSFTSAILLPLFLAAGCSDDRSKTHEEIRAATLTSMFMVDRGGDAIKKQLFPTAVPVMVDLADWVVYFAFPEKLCDKAVRNSAVSRYLYDTSQVGWSRLEDSVVWIDRYRRRYTPEKACVCRFSVDQLRIDSTAILRFPYPVGDYTVSLLELTSNKMGDFVLDSNATIDETESPASQAFPFFIYNGEEPTLRRFVRLIAPESSDREKRLQAILSFVNSAIQNDTNEYLIDGTLVKSPMETMMSGMGGPFSRMALLCSLFEAVGEDYRIIEYDRFLNVVAVPLGRFIDTPEGTEFVDGEGWALCDLNDPNARIGSSAASLESDRSAPQRVYRP